MKFALYNFCGKGAYLRQQLLAAGQADCFMGYDTQTMKAWEQGIQARDKVLEHLLETVDVPVPDGIDYVPVVIAGVLIVLFSIEHILALLRGEEVLTQADPRHVANGGREGGRGRGGDTIMVTVAATPGMSRATALQQGRDIGDGITRARARNG